MHVDPEAARAVFSAWAEAVERDAGVVLPLALGLDVTEQAKLLPGHLARLGVGAGTDGRTAPRARRSRRGPGRPKLRHPDAVCASWPTRCASTWSSTSRYDGFYGAFMHDPFAVAIALDATLARSQALAVDVELAGRITTGQTVADWRGLWGRAANADVAIEGDAPLFLERLVERLGALAARVG